MVTDAEVEETFNFVAREFGRLTALGADVMKEIDGNNFTCVIHDAERRMRFIGRDAYERLRELTSRAVAGSQYRNRLDPERTFRCIRDGFGRDYMRADYPGSTAADDLAALMRWLDEAAEACTSLTHFVPCHIRLPEDEKCVLGPVCFEPLAVALPDVAESLSTWTAEDGADTAWRANDSERVTTYLGAFSDLARVTIHGCDWETSRRVAEEVVQAALSHLHVMGGADRTRKVRLGGPAVNNAARSTIAFSASKGPYLTWSGDWEGARLDEAFWPWLRTGKRERMADAVGGALSNIASREDLPMLAARYLDAAAWYADAATESRRPAAIVKYLTSMERLLWTGEKRGITRRLSQRAAALCFTVEDWNFEELASDIERAYGLRSGIVHGRLARDAPEINRSYWLCERVARDLLITWLERYGDGFGREVEMDHLKAHLDSFVEEVLEETAARRKSPEG